MRSLIILAASCGLVAQVHLPGTSGHKSSGSASTGEASDGNHAAGTTGDAETKKATPPAKSAVDEPDGYVLELGWAPASRTRFVVAAFEPQLQDGSILESCGKPEKLPGKVTRLAAPYVRAPADAQREWNAHGACSGLSPGDYFTRMIQARVAVQLPVQLTSLEGEANASGEEIELYFAGANTTFPPKSFQARCARGVFTGMRISFDRDLTPRERRGEVNACGANAKITSQSTPP